MASPQIHRVSSNGELELTELEVDSESGGRGREEDPWEDYQDYKKVDGEVDEPAPTTSAKVDEGLNDPRGTVTPVQDLVQTADNEGEPLGDERFDSLPSARVAALTNRRKKRKVAPSSSEDLALLPQGSESADTDVVPPMRRGHLRSHSARQHPRVVHFDPQQLRRTSSLPRNTSAAANIAITILDDINDRDFSKVSTLPLAQRIHYSQQRSTGSFHGARVSFAGKAKDVWLPKFVSWGKEVLSWELWNNHMKVIEGHFGTGVVSYFIFLRWLFFINLFTLFIWLAFVNVPHFVWRASPEGMAAFQNSSLSQLSCLLNPTMHPAHENAVCPRGNETVFTTCLQPNTSVRFQVSTCNDPSSGSGIRWSSSGVQSVYSESVCTTPMMNTSLVMCRNVEGEDIFALQYVVDIITGQGIFNTTLLFIGQYFNGSINGVYDYPVGFLLTTGVIYLVFIVLIIVRMGKSFSDNYTANLIRGKKVDYCNKVFTAWDFNISDRKAAKLQRASIKTNLEETLNDEEKRNRKRSIKEWAFVVIIRIITNIFVLASLVAGGLAIFYAVQFSTSQQLKVEGVPFDPGALISPAVISVLNYILPLIYQLVAKFERYKTRSGEVKMTLFRAISVRLASIIVLIASLYNRIICTQPDPNEGAEVCTAASAFLSNVTGCTDSLECWETVIGQELYSQVVFNFGIILAVPIVAESAKKILSLFLNWKRVRNIFTIRGIQLGDKIPREFDLPKSILDLIYTQTLLWLGLMFSPVIPLIVSINLFLLFYVKRYSLTINLSPSQGGAYRAARTNFTFLLLLLATLLGCLGPVGFTIAALRPSNTCGPFRGRMSFYAVVEDRIDTIDNCGAQAAANFFTSVGFMVPVILLLFMSTLGLGMVARARGRTKQLLQKQLHSESANVSYLMERLIEDNTSDKDSVFDVTRRSAYIPKNTSKARQYQEELQKKKGRERHVLSSSSSGQ